MQRQIFYTSVQVYTSVQANPNIVDQSFCPSCLASLVTDRYTDPHFISHQSKTRRVSHHSINKTKEKKKKSNQRVMQINKITHYHKKNFVVNL